MVLAILVVSGLKLVTRQDVLVSSERKIGGGGEVGFLEVVPPLHSNR